MTFTVNACIFALVLAYLRVAIGETMFNTSLKEVVSRWIVQ